MNRTTVAFCVAAAVVAAVLTWRSVDTTARDAQVEAVSPASPAPASAEIAASSSAPMELRGVGASVSTGQPAVPPTLTFQASTPLAKIPVSTHHQQLFDLGREDSNGDDSHTMLEKEPKDPNWAYGAEQRIRQLYEEAGAEIFSIECRSSTCEVQAFIDNPESDPHIVDVAPWKDPSDLQMFARLSIPIAGRQVHLSYFRKPVPRDPPTEAELEGRRRRQQILAEYEQRRRATTD